MHSEGPQPMPYYETSIEPMECAFIAFQEIVARPLINEYIVSSCDYYSCWCLFPVTSCLQIKSDTEREQISFAHEVSMVVYFVDICNRLSCDYS